MSNDFINMTQGQLLLNYWWMWLIIFIAFLVVTGLPQMICKVIFKVFKNAWIEYKR